jgi:hypothetical protein
VRLSQFFRELVCEMQLAPDFRGNGRIFQKAEYQRVCQVVQAVQHCLQRRPGLPPEAFLFRGLVHDPPAGATQIRRYQFQHLDLILHGFHGLQGVMCSGSDLGFHVVLVRAVVQIHQLKADGGFQVLQVGKPDGLTQKPAGFPEIDVGQGIQPLLHIQWPRFHTFARGRAAHGKRKGFHLFRHR